MGNLREAQNQRQQPDGSGGTTTKPSSTFLISALADLRPNPDPCVTTRLLARVLREATEHLEASVEPRRWFISLVSARLIAPDGTSHRGIDILQQYATAREEAKKARAAGEASDTKATRPLLPKEAFRAVIDEERGILIPKSNQIAFGGTFSLPLPPDDVRGLSDLDSSDLENVLQLILEHQFAGDVFEMSQAAVESTHYRLPSGVCIRGDMWLQECGYRRWLDNGGDPAKGRDEVSKLKGYTAADVMEGFRKSRLAMLMTGQPCELVELESVTSALVGRQDMERGEIETILTEICQVLGKGASKVLSTAHAPLVMCRGKDGSQLPLMSLIERYAYACWREAHASADEDAENGISPATVLSRRGYGLTETLRKIRVRIGLDGNGHRTAARMSDQEIREYVQSHQLGPLIEVLSQLGTNPQVIIEGLRLLRSNLTADIPLTELVPRYLGLSVERSRRQRGGIPPGVCDGGGLNPFIEGLLRAAQAGERLDFNELQYQSAKDLTIRGYRRQFEVDPEGVIRLLASEEAKYTESEQPLLTAEQRALLIRLFTETHQYFKEIYAENLDFMKTPPFRYQLEGVRFLACRDCALLADAAGLAKTYQLVAAAILRNFRQVLYLTPPGTVHNVREEILLHSQLKPEQVKIITSESPESRRRQIESLNGERFVIVGYDTLGVLYESYPELYARLHQGADLAIYDEAHIPENIDTRRGEAVQALPVSRRWYSTATPWRNGIEGIWWILHTLDPQTFPDKAVFRERFCQSTEGLYDLHAILHGLMLRRTMEDTIDPFEDPAQVPFDEQLKGGRPRVPKQRLIAPDNCGSYVLGRAQEEVIRWMVADFAGWAADFNERFADPSTMIDLDNINPLSKFIWLHKAIYEPEEVGLGPPATLIRELDRIVSERLALGEKVILWVQRHDTADRLHARYSKYGAMVADGRTKVADRFDIVGKFQNDPAIRVLIGNEEALGTGFTITVANTAVQVQPSITPTRWIQTLGRHQRVIGLSNIQFAKQHANTIVMIPHFSADLLHSTEDPHLAEILRRGTLPEQTYRRIRGGRALFQIVTEGYRNEDDLNREFHQSLFEGLGLIERKRFDLTGGYKPSVRSMAEAAERFLPVWKKIQGDVESELAVTRLIAQARFHGKEVIEIAHAFCAEAQVSPPALQFASAILEIKNRFVREQLLQVVPWVVRNAERYRDVLAENASIEEQEGLVSIVRLCPLIAEAVSHENVAVVAPEWVSQITGFHRGPLGQQVRQQFLFGILGVLSSPEACTLLMRHAPAPGEVSVPEYVRTVYQLGHLARQKQLGSVAPSGTGFSELAACVSRQENAALETFAGVEPGSIERMLRSDANWSNSVDHLLALLTGWKEMQNERILAQAREVYAAIFENRMPELRYGEQARAGNPIQYRLGQKAFWSEFARNAAVLREDVELTRRHLTDTIYEEYRVLRREVGATACALEGLATRELFSTVFRFDSKNIRQKRMQYEQDAAALGAAMQALHEGRALSTDSLEACDRYGVERDLTPADLRKAVQHRLQELNRALGWLVLEESFEAFRRSGVLTDPEAVKDRLSRAAKFYACERADHLAFGFERLHRLVTDAASGRKQVVRVAVEETDHPAHVSRMGAMSASMINCFNPDGDPFFTSWVLGALASKNFKLILVRQGGPQGEVIACAPYKVRKGSNQVGKDSVHLFLERGLSDYAYDFRAEMLDLLSAKAQSIQEQVGEPVIVCHQVLGRLRRSDIRVFGTGAYTDEEYAEAVFHLRNARSVTHLTRIYDPEVFRYQRDELRITGLGLGKRSIEDLIAELRDIGAAVVIDVRPNPVATSQKRAHLDGEALEVILPRYGIPYQYWGDRLGNRGANAGTLGVGQYIEFMTTEQYRLNREALLGEIAKFDGTVVIVTNEPKNNKCFRRLVVSDLLQHSAEEENDQRSTGNP